MVGKCRTDYAHDRPSPISRTSQAFRKGPRPSFSSRILKRRILPDVRLRAVIRLRPVPVNTNLARLSSQRIRSAWIAFCRSTMVIGSWTCGGAISPYTSTFFKASISCVSGVSAMAPIQMMSNKRLSKYRRGPPTAEPMPASGPTVQPALSGRN